MGYRRFNTAEMRNIASSIDSCMDRYHAAKDQIDAIINRMPEYFSDPTSRKYREKMAQLQDEVMKLEDMIRQFADRIKEDAGIVEAYINNMNV